MVRKSLYCGGPAVSLSQWFGAGVSRSAFSEDWPQLQGRTVIGTLRGRTAVALACRLLEINANHEILVPAYNCGTEIDALLHCGADLVGYQVTRRCDIDLEDLFSRITKRTRAVYVIHYFGWEQPMEDLRAWCDEHGLLLIEDCALALFSGGQTGGIGRHGDAAIYSLPKSLGLVQGGLLSLAASPKAGLPTLKPPGTEVWLSEIRYSTRTAVFENLEKLGVYGTLVSARRRHRAAQNAVSSPEGLPDMPGNYYFNPELEAERALHPKTESLLNTIPWRQEVRSRRENYIRLSRSLDGISGASLLFDHLPSGVCPLSLPLLVENRDQCARNLQARGIGAYPWWAGFHHGALEWSSFPDACWLKNHIMTVPVYSGMTTRQCDELAEMITEILSPAG